MGMYADRAKKRREQLDAALGKEMVFTERTIVEEEKPDIKTTKKQGTKVPYSGLDRASRKGMINTYTGFKSFSERKKEEEEKKKKTDRYSGLQKASTAGTEKLYTDFSKTSKEKPKNDIWEGLKRATIAGDPTPTAEEKDRAENFFKGVGTSIAATVPTMWNLISQTRKDWKEKVEREGLQSALSEMARNMDNPDYTFGEPLSKDSKGYKLYQKANEYFAKSQEGLSPTEQYMSQLAASGAQVLSTLPLSALTGSPYPTLALMGANAAASKANELTDQGKTATEILGRSVLSGAIETATEKIPLDELFSIARFGGKGILKSALKQYGVEGSEELLSYIMNYAADVANNDETADFSLKEAFLNFAGGGLVGAALGAGASYIGSFNQATPFNVNVGPGAIGGLIGNTDSGVSYSDIGKRINEIGALDGVVNIGLENDIGTTSRSMSEDINARIENGEIITDEETGRLYEETVKDFEARKADSVQPIDEPVNISTESTNDFVDNTDEINIPQENSVISDVVDTPIQNYEPEISNLPAISEEYQFNIDDILQQTANEMIAANRADAINKIENSQNEIGENGAKALRTYYNDSYNFDDYYNGFIRYYEAGKVGLPIEQVNTLYGNNIAPEVKYAAYMTGINDAQAEVSVKAPVKTSIETSAETPDIITNISETAAPVITPVTTPATTKSSPKKKYKTIKTKKSDWNSHDVEWHTPNQKTPVAYSTVATSDMIEVLSEDNPTATIKEIKNLINYDPEAKRVLQQYIEAGYGDDIASEFFSRDNKVSAKESAENGKSKLAEVSDEGRIQQSDISGQSRGRLLDKVPSENVQPDEGRRNIVSDVDEDVDYSVDTSEKPKQSNYADQWTAQRVGDTETAPKTLSEIVAKLQHDFGVNITTGHIRGNGVRGLYNKSNKGIKTKIANDIPTISHELGHFIDKKYNIINDDLSKELEKELVDNLGDEMKEAYDKKKWKTEGFAEFMRKFMQNREVTAIDYPKFTKHFLNSLDGKDQAILLQFADDINAYYALDADTATSSVRLREEKAFDARTTSEKIKDKASVFYQAWVDSNYGIKRFDKATGSNAYTLATNSAYSDSVAGQVIIGDLTDINGKYVAPGLRTVLQGINLQDKNEYRLFGEYLLVKHGPERLAEGMRVFADDRKNSTAFMEKRKAELEEQYPAFKQASERLYSFINDFYETWAVKTGLISQDTLNKWNDRWEYYVPLNRAVGDKGLAGAKKGFANQNSTIKRAKGSGLDVVHPVDNLINNIVNVVNAGTRNNVMVHITDSAEQLHADARFIEKVSAPLKIQKADLRGVKLNISNKIEELGLKSSDQEAVDEIVSGINDILIQYGRGKAYGDVVTVLKNGEPEYWKINDPLLLSSLTNMAQSKMDGILDAYAIISRFMTSNITGNNAVWSIFSNAPRDAMALFTYSVSKNPIEVFGAIGKAYINKIRMSLGKEVDPLYREYLAMGGGSTSAYTADRDLAKRARKSFTGKKFSANPLDWIAFVSDTVEMGPRFATYKMLRDRGVNPQEAFFGAMDITVNFRRGGRYARQINKAVPFFNAGVQGLDKFARWISADDIKGSGRKKAAAYRTFGFIAASAILAAIVYALNNSDEEKEKEYEQLSSYIKNGFWNIPLGDGKYFAIPKPRELGVLSSFIERTMERTIGENEYAFKDFYGYVAENYLPKILSDVAQVGDKGLEETGMSILGNFGLFGIVAYLGANRDFLGRPIVSGSLERLEPKQQYTNRTSKIAYWIGQAFNMSPVKIDYFFNQVLGGWWKYQKALFPIDEQYRDFSLGVGNTYIKDNQYSNDLTDWLYDKAEESTTAKNSYPNDIDKAITAKMDNSMKDFYSRYYQLAKDKPETDQSRITRQKVLDMIYDYRAASDSGYFGKYVEQVKEFCKKVGDESYLPSVMPTEIKDGRDKKHQLTDTQYVEYQELYNTEYWNLVEDTFKKSASEKKNTIVLKKIAIVAQEEATNKMLKKMGLPKTGYAEKYKGIDSDDVVDFMTEKYLAEEDGGVDQKELAEIILDMDLNSEDSYTLFFSRFKDNERATTAYDAGIDADDYFSFLVDIDDVTADYEENPDGTYRLAKDGDKIPKKDSRKNKIITIINDMGVYEEYDYDVYWALMEAADYKRPYDD